MTNTAIKRKHFLLIVIGGLTAILLLVVSSKTIHYTSTNQFCAACHIHPHADVTWKLSSHHNTRSGVSVNCVDCHLPPQDQQVQFLTRKAYHGVHDFYVYLTKDSAEIDWSEKRNMESAKRFVYEDGCKKCHTNLFPSTLNELGAQAHLKYTRNPENTSCLNCHLNVGHYRGKTGFSGTAEVGNEKKEIFSTPAIVTGFENFDEKIPGTSVSFKMVAVPGGTFNMGTPADEPFRNSDEGPVINVAVDSFWMGEIEVSWNEYLAFFNATSSQGRKEAVTQEKETDAISGATPPWGAPDQGWGKGTRPAITMSHLAALTYCRWLSQVTGKKYRLPTEAEWEYAARGGTNTPYFFEGSPKDFETDGLWSKIFGADTAVINSYVIYNENSPTKTMEPLAVKANPYGLKNMLGNVSEFCLDFYDPTVYSKYPKGLVKNPRGPRNGMERVVRGGAYNYSAKDLRVGRRDFTHTKDWLVTDPQIPKSIWWYSDSKNVGFRVVCEFSKDITVTKKD